MLQAGTGVDCVLGLRWKLAAFVGVAAVVFAVVSGIRLHASYESSLAAARRQAIEAQLKADSVVAWAAKKAQAADAEKQQATRVLDSAAVLVRTAAAADVSLHQRETAFAQSVATAPDTCAAVVADATAATAAAKADADAWKASAEAAMRAAARLQAAYDSLSEAHQAVLQTQRNLERATGNLVRAVKPSLLGRLLPRPVIAVVGGFDTRGRPNGTVGIGLGWTF